MMHRVGLSLWIAAGLAAGLLILQTALADSDRLAWRYVLALLLIIGGALAGMVLARRRARDVLGPAPEPVALVLSGLAALCLWAAVWWLMDLSNAGLQEVAGTLPLPISMFTLSDRLLGMDIQPAIYELHVLYSVVLMPLASGWLLWGLVQPDLGALVGRWRAAWIAGLVAGVFMALTGVQNIAPALPSGLASVGGYVIVGLVAALVVYLTGSPWAGFAAHSTFAYATLRWSDDLLREFLGKGYLDAAWLTVIILGALGAAVLLQILRFRTPRPPDSERRADWRGVTLPLALFLAALVIMAVVEFGRRG